MNRAGIAAVAAALLAVACPVTRASAPPTYPVGKLGAERVYEVYRTSPAPRRLRMTFDIDKPPHELSTIQSVGLVRHGASWDIPLRFDDGFTGYAELGSGENWPAVYGLPAALPPCPHPQLCTSQFGGVRFTVDSNDVNRLTFFFQLLDATATVTLLTPGWRLRETHKVRFRRVLGEEVSTGVTWEAEEIEHFTGATMAGGRYGSRARAFLPCDDAGHGTAKLSGGIEEPAKSDTKPNCTRVELGGWQGGEDVAYKATTWRLTGDVVGAGRFHARLTVVDFPKP
jgi:hypothetical protein